MKKNHSIAGWLMLLALSTFNLQTATAVAQGTAFTYQGQLNANGSPATGLYDLRFTIYDAVTNGDLIAGPLTNSATGVTNGLFAVTLDFGAGAFTGPARWLEVDVRTNGSGAFTPLLPLQPLLPMPYAIMANSASNLLGTLPAGQLSGALPATQLSGTLPLAELPAAVVTNGTTGVALTGTFSGSGAGLTGVPGTFTWQNVTGTNQQAQSNTGYLANNAAQVTITLPASPNVGDIVCVSGVGAGGWQITPNSGQSFLGVAATTNWNALTNWTQTSASNSAPANESYWHSIASSSDGTKLAAVVRGGGIYTSTNSGATWTQTSAPGEYGWDSIASSSDGTKLAAVAAFGGIWTSTNSGGTWNLTSALGWWWNSIASSADGTKLAAVQEDGVVELGGIYTSTNSGGTWNLTSAPGEDWNSIASSADGTELAATAFEGWIYSSTNSGVTWTQTSAPGEYCWNSIASSADGTKLAAVYFFWNGSSYSGAIYSSTNSGVTWIQSGAPPEEWISIASSADGTKLAAVVDEGGIYTSTNSGVTWIQTSAPSEDWISIASSVDGTKLAAVVIGGGIWTAQAMIQTNLTGGQNSAIALQYTGNGQWQPLNQSQIAAGAVGSAQLATNLTVSGSLAAAAFSGNGSGLTGLSASELTNGTVPLAQLSGITSNQLDGGTWQLATNLNGGNAALASNVISGIAITNAFITNSVFAGDGTGLTNLNAVAKTGDTMTGTLYLPLNGLVCGEPAEPQLVLSGWNVGIGTATPQYALDVNGVVNATAIYQNGIQMAGGPWANNGSSIYYVVGNVGIGTISPQQALSVAGTVESTIGGFQFPDGTLQTTAAKSGPWTASGGSIYYNAGNVGVGTTNPTATLVVNGTVAAVSFAGNGGGLTNLNASQLTSIGNTNSGATGNFFVGPAGNSTTFGSYNTANGYQALLLNSSGFYNTANGFEALGNNTSGNNNIALGYMAGWVIGTGSSNIDIGNLGVIGDANVIRIGSGQTATYIAGVINGNGGGLTNLNASQLSSGTISVAQLPLGIAYLTPNQTFLGSQNFVGGLTATNGVNAFAGNGGGLTNLSAAQLTGVVPLAQIPAAVVTNNEAGLSLAGAFTGNGGGLTNLNASQLNSGTVPLAQLPLPVLMQTNFIDGQRYTNTYGWPLMIEATIILNTAAVAGSANESFCIQASPAVGGFTNVCAISTLTTSAALHYTNHISGFVPTNAIYWFTNLSTGTGNSGAVNGGQIKYP